MSPVFRVFHSLPVRPVLAVIATLTSVVPYARAQAPSAAAKPTVAKPAAAQPMAPPPATVNLGLGAAPGQRDPGQAPPLVEVELAWSPEGFPGKVRFFELSPQSIERLAETRSVRDAARSLPIVREVTDGKVIVNSGSYKMVAMVIENPTNEPIYFFAAPHSIEPVEEGIGIKFICLCNGFIYRAKPHMYWYRIMQLKISPANRSPKFKLMHSVRRVDPKNLPSTSDQIAE